DALARSLTVVRPRADPSDCGCIGAFGPEPTQVFTVSPWPDWVSRSSRPPSPPTPPPCGCGTGPGAGAGGALGAAGEAEPPLNILPTSSAPSATISGFAMFPPGDR